MFPNENNKKDAHSPRRFARPPRARVVSMSNWQGQSGSRGAALRTSGIQSYVRPGENRGESGGARPGRPGAPRHPGRRPAPARGGMRRAQGLTGKHYDDTRHAISESREMRHHVAEKKTAIPPLEAGAVRVVILGGVEEIGRNMAAIEYGNDILIIDCGFMFKDEDTPGVDYILPNTQYLEERKEKIRGVFITHGHLDHIGGLPYILERIGNPPVYARNLTGLFIQKRHEEFPGIPPVNLQIVETTERISFADTAVRFFKVTHTIPDSMGIIVEKPYCVIVHTGDLKLDHLAGVPTEEELSEYGKFKN